MHPEFRAIFTSNPVEYAGVHKSQDALMDRLITISMSHYDRDTEVAVTMASSGVSQRAAQQIVDMPRRLRQFDPTRQRPSIRAAIMIARVLIHRGATCDPSDPVFTCTCHDVLRVDTSRSWNSGALFSPEQLQTAIGEAFAAPLNFGGRPIAAAGGEKNKQSP